MNSKIAFAASSRGSNNNYTFKFKSAYLVVLVQPEKSQVGDTNRLPVVLHLFARAIDDVGHFVGNHELKVLSRSKVNQRSKSKNLQLKPARRL